jgi:hypothetical protein
MPRKPKLPPPVCAPASLARQAAPADYFERCTQLPARGVQTPAAAVH